MEETIKRGYQLELEIESLAFGARGVAKWHDYVIFVDRGLPGQKVLAQVRRLRKNYGEAYVIRELEASPLQIEPPCPYFGTCGGCQLQNLNYQAQVEAKSKQIKEILTRLGGFHEVPMIPIIPAEKIYGYRNKMEFSGIRGRHITTLKPFFKTIRPVRILSNDYT